MTAALQCPSRPRSTRVALVPVALLLAGVRGAVFVRPAPWVALANGHVSEREGVGCLACSFLLRVVDAADRSVGSEEDYAACFVDGAPRAVPARGVRSLAGEVVFPLQPCFVADGMNVSLRWHRAATNETVLLLDARTSRTSFARAPTELFADASVPRTFAAVGTWALATQRVRVPAQTRTSLGLVVNTTVRLAETAAAWSENDFVQSRFVYVNVGGWSADVTLAPGIGYVLRTVEEVAFDVVGVPLLASTQFLECAAATLTPFALLRNRTVRAHELVGTFTDGDVLLSIDQGRTEYATFFGGWSSFVMVPARGYFLRVAIAQSVRIG